MILLTPEIRAQLQANADAHHAAQAEGRREPDAAPVVKFFNPVGAATWLFSELDADGDALFGLCDLGFGCPELGYASLFEIESLRLSWGLRIERDLCFESHTPMTVWADTARRLGSIRDAETVIAGIERANPIPPATDG
ncbi:hypothetical protein QE385_003239 [Sphingomonas sp. SORGH_AS 950]|uniref:DUF2958 domain-containing protein n=1 Tax=Sphingomonas sp. SORGH_AS_0950 TaxID=3041792 RepID=UPI0027827E6F|nr:DUF2958 domain-containing protein [Sphingomonas sp. SORGH_AS_0950]MDQ1158912.1 hypothetical protein [Sphingomonas sp. SORGH_AS_0950]